MTATTADPDTAVRAVEDLTRRAVQAQTILLDTGDTDVDTSVLVRVRRHDESIQIEDLEHLLSRPRSQSGLAALHDPTSFAAYVTRLHDVDETTVWADDRTRRVVAVLNDHDPGIIAGWRDHRVQLDLRVDPDWAAWTAADGKLMNQMLFGEFLEDHLGSIVDPPAAELMDVAMTLVAKRNLAFESSARLQSGDVGFVYREETTAKAGSKGQLEIPQHFRIRVAPFVGSDPVDVAARLRYRISGEGLQLGYRLDRPDLRELEAFGFVVDLLRTGIPQAVPLLFGTAPEALR